MDRKKELQIMHEYLSTDITRKELIKKHKMEVGKMNSLGNRYKPIVKFDEKLFLNLLANDINNLTQTELLKKYNLSFNKQQEIKHGNITIKYKTLMKWLRKLGVEYDLKIEHDINTTSNLTMKLNLHGLTKKEEKQEPKREREIYTMTHDEKKEYNEKISILDNQRKHLVEKLYAKGLSVETINTIMSSMNVIAREALLIGVMAEKNGYGNKVEYAIARKVEER